MSRFFDNKPFTNNTCSQFKLLTTCHKFQQSKTSTSLEHFQFLYQGIGKCQQATFRFKKPANSLIWMLLVCKLPEELEDPFQPMLHGGFLGLQSTWSTSKRSMSMEWFALHSASKNYHVCTELTWTSNLKGYILVKCKNHGNSIFQFQHSSKVTNTFAKMDTYKR